MGAGDLLGKPRQRQRLDGDPPFSLNLLDEPESTTATWSHFSVHPFRHMWY